MAYQFNGTSHRLTLGGSPATGLLNVGFIAFYPTDNTLADQVLCVETNSTGANNFGVWYGSTSVGGKCYYIKNAPPGAPSGQAISSAAANLNEWNYLFWSDDSISSPRTLSVSLNGEALQTVTASLPAGTTTTATCVGFLRTGLTTGSNWFKGYIAELAWWNTPLQTSHGDIWKMLYQRYSAIKCVPGGAVTGVGLTNYFSMRKGLNDPVGGRLLGGGANAPTRVDEHPPIRYPKPPVLEV